MQFILGESAVAVTSQLAAEWSLFLSGEAGNPAETLRIWQTSTPTVVLGRSPRAPDDIVENACRADRVPVVRRLTGGGAVVLGPGCLNYAVVLSLSDRPLLANVGESFEWILRRITSALDVRDLAVAGQTDLALAGRKVSGNAQRRGRRMLLHHGTLLHAFDASLASRYLEEPARQPAYRASRPHRDFLTNLPLSSAEIISRLRAVWTC
jgi:lipoate-protein ligase A